METPRLLARSSARTSMPCLSSSLTGCTGKRRWNSTTSRRKLRFTKRKGLAMHRLLLVLVLAMPVAFGLAAGGREDAADKEPYVLGWMTDAAGPAKDTYYPEAIGFELYVKALNDRGGINGHPISLKIEDYGLDSAKGAAAARKLVERDKVLILLGLSIEATMPSIFEVARASNTPVMTGHSSRLDTYPPADPLIFTMGNVFEPATDTMVRLTERP